MSVIGNYRYSVYFIDRPELYEVPSYPNLTLKPGTPERKIIIGNSARGATGTKAIRL